MPEDIPHADVDRDTLLEFLREERDFYEGIHRDADETTKASAYTKGRYQSYADVLAWTLAACDKDQSDK